MAAVVIPTSVPVTERAGSRLVFYWDLRNRQSYFQVTNEGSKTVKIHVQVWNASSSTCAQFDFIDTLTPFDSHVYDLSALDRNDGQPLAAPNLSGGHGFVAVTSVNNTGAFLQADSLTGNFTVVDLPGGTNTGRTPPFSKMPSSGAVIFSTSTTSTPAPRQTWS